MLIKSREEQDEKKITRHASCAWCKRQLDYPRIIADDAHATSYHPLCALQLATHIIADTSALLNAKDLPEIAQRIVLTNMMSAPEKGQQEEDISPMAQAFRAARLAGRQQETNQQQES
jgi:hypothetical protein